MPVHRSRYLIASAMPDGTRRISSIWRRPGAICSSYTC